MNNLNGEALVKNDFNAIFVIASYRKDAHRFSYRWERFRIDDRDETPMNSNEDVGNSYTLSYAYYFGKRWELIFEGIRRNSKMSPRQYLGLPEEAVEDQLLLNVRYYFDWESDNG